VRPSVRCPDELTPLIARSQQQKESDSGCLGCLAALLCCCCLGGAFCPPFLLPRLTVYVSEQRCAVEGWRRTRFGRSDFSHYFTAYLTQDVFFLSCLLVIYLVPDESFERGGTGRGASLVGYCFRCRALGRQMLRARRVPEQRGTDPSPDRPFRVRDGLAQRHLPSSRAYK
jgi:hypothetical protein